MSLPALGTNNLILSQTTIIDSVGAIELSSHSPNCATKRYSQYNTYTADVSSIGLTNPNGNGVLFDTGTCVTFSSFLVTTQTSKRGSDWKQMLLDEGSITGGVTFFTWFF